VTRRAAVAAVVAAAAAAGCGGEAHHAGQAAPAARTPAGWSGHAVDQPTRAPGFALLDQQRRRVSLHALHGDVVLVTFLYTRCPDLCPLLARRVDAALRLLTRPQRAHVRVLAVSVDPEHDTPGAVRRFLAEHRLLPQFRYLTETRARLRPVWQSYNVLATPRDGEAIDHSAYVALVDRRGELRVTFEASSAPRVIARDVRRALAG
jgi:protein SCO1/2